MVVLLWRFYRRIRPAEKKQEPVARVAPTRMPKVEGSEALRRHRDGES